MLTKTRIRSQLHVAIIVTVLMMLTLSFVSFNGSLEFRSLTKSIRGRANELPLVANIGVAVSDLRSALWEITSVNGDYQFAHIGNTISPITFMRKLDVVSNALKDYRHQLERIDASDSLIADHSAELAYVDQFEESLARIYEIVDKGDWVFETSKSIDNLEAELEQLQRETSRLPGFLSGRMDEFANNARSVYHWWMALTLVGLLLACSSAAWLYFRFNRQVFDRLEKVAIDSRRVAKGEFDYRIELETDEQDEVADLAEALNAMTSNFQKINNELNSQVKQRTQEVVRSEKMASVGFLAAGVAHEINNPLAAILWSAEALESRVNELFDAQSTLQFSPEENKAAAERMKKYLQRILEQGFRCRDITSRLLDFSRMGDTKKTKGNLNQIFESVVSMVQPLSAYRDKNIHLLAETSVNALLNEQEIKQVALNLITNALDSLDPGGVVEIEIFAKDDKAIIEIRDNGCGMTQETISQLFEPFFTRRRNGQGTGLGLSITYQIIHDHDGSIEPFSNGPDQGSTFTVSLPLVKNERKRKIAA